MKIWFYPIDEILMGLNTQMPPKLSVALIKWHFKAIFLTCSIGHNDKSFHLTLKLPPTGDLPLPPWLCACMKLWKKKKKMYKITVQRDFMKLALVGLSDKKFWLKILSPRGYLPLPRGYVNVLNHDKKFYKTTVQRARPIYGKNPLNFVFFGTSESMAIGLGMRYWGHRPINHSLFTWWPWVDQVKFGPLCFCMGKKENNGFLGTIIDFVMIFLNLHHLVIVTKGFILH